MEANNYKQDVLQILPDEDIAKLRDLLKTKSHRSLYACNYLNSCIEWKRKRPGQNYYTLMVPDGKWEHGTFICLMQFTCYDLFVYTIEDNCDTLYNCLINTQRIAWKKDLLFFAICEDQTEAVRKALNFMSLKFVQTETQAWMVEKEKALLYDISCDPDVHVKEVDLSHVPQINMAWPHRYPNSENYLSTFIDMNYGYGVFLKSDNKLVAWALKNHFGAIGILQVEENYFRKGYGSLICKVLARKLAEENVDSFGFVIKTNIPSNTLFTGLGFHVFCSVWFIQIQ